MKNTNQFIHLYLLLFIFCFLGNVRADLPQDLFSPTYEIQALREMEAPLEEMPSDADLIFYSVLDDYVLNLQKDRNRRFIESTILNQSYLELQAASLTGWQNYLAAKNLLYQTDLHLQVLNENRSRQWRNFQTRESWRNILMQSLENSLTWGTSAFGWSLGSRLAENVSSNSSKHYNPVIVYDPYRNSNND